MIANDFGDYSASHASDFNADGIGDLIVGDINGDGVTDVIFGNKKGLPADLDVRRLDGSIAFALTCAGSNVSYFIVTLGDWEATFTVLDELSLPLANNAAERSLRH